MNLAATVASESGVPIDAVMLLRHGNDSVALLRKHNVSIEEYTSVQPVDSKYDYWRSTRPRIEVVVAIADDHVYAVYRVLGIEQTGSNLDVSSPAYHAFEAARNSPTRVCHRFELQLLPSACTGLKVFGWQGRERTPTQRYGDSIFAKVEVNKPDSSDNRASLEARFRERVLASLELTAAQRAQRLAKAPTTPSRLAVSTTVFVRNPDVVAEVLLRANGVCEICAERAPFNRKSDGSPYLEVHHRTPLANGGEDTVSNALAACPNCHRRAHYG